MSLHIYSSIYFVYLLISLFMYLVIQLFDCLFIYAYLFMHLSLRFVLINQLIGYFMITLFELRVFRS